MRILPALLFALGWLLSSASFSQTIELGDLLDTVKQDHPLFRREARAVDVEEERRDQALGAQDWRFSARLAYAYQEPPGDDLFTPRSVHNSDIQVGLERRIWNTGGQLSLSAGESYSDLDLRPFDLGGVAVLPGLPHYFETRVYLSYSQPLWRNCGGALDRLEYELSGFAVEIAETRAAEAQEQFLLDVALRFLDWAFLSDQQGIAGERLRLAEEQLEQVRRRREMNLVEEVDILRALDAVHAAEQGVVQIAARYGSRQAELAEVSQREDLYNLVPRYDLYGLADMPDPESAVGAMLTRSRLLRTLSVARQRLERELAAAVEIQDPELSLDLGYGMRRQEDGFLDALAASKPDAFVALNLRFPVGQREARSRVQQLRLLILQVKDETQEAEIQLESALRALLIEIAQLGEVLQLDRRRIASAQEKAAEELRLYNQGRGQLTFVIAARDEVERAQLSHSQNALVYQKLLFQYREVMDEILPDSTQG
jgi:outer membrane protein TolC